MSSNTTNTQHDLAPSYEDVEIHTSRHISESKPELNAQEAAGTLEDLIVEDAESEDHTYSPRGGLKAWLYVFATFLLFISAWGLTQVFGIFQEIYLTTLLHNTSPSAISWIGSVQCFLVLMLGAFAGPLFDAGYLRPLLLLGCSLIVLGMATLSLATAYWHVFLSQGLCVGLGAGLTFVPSLAFITTLFPPSTRPWAIGCANSGGSVGGIIFTFMLSRLIPIIGFSWAVRAVALVNFILSVTALAIILPHCPRRPSRRRAILDLRAFRELSFMLFALALFFNYVAFYIPAFYLPTIARVTLHQSQDFAFEAIVFVAVGSFLGRLIPMLAASLVGSMQVYLVATLAAVVVLFAWTAVHNVPGFVIFSVVYGLISGTLVAAPSAAISHPVLSPSMSVIGMRLGILWMFGSVGILIGAPIAGAVVDVKRAYFVPGQCFAGAVVAAASMCLVAPFLAVLRYDRKPKI